MCFGRTLLLCARQVDTTVASRHALPLVPKLVAPNPLVLWVPTATRSSIVEVKMKGDTKGTLRAPITQAVMDLAREEVKHACNHFEV